MRPTRLGALLCAPTVLWLAAPARADEPMAFKGPVVLDTGVTVQGKVMVDADHPLPVTCPDGTCSGSGGGGGGGAVTVADGADVTQGALADAACATDNGTCSISAILKRNTQRISSLITSMGTPLQAGGATPYHAISTASTNSTLIATGARTLYSLTLTGLNTTAAYVRFYDSASAPTCSSATGAKHTYLVIGSATQQGGMIVPIPAQGEAYASGLSFCVTGGSADTDNTSGPAGVLINASYK